MEKVLPPLVLLGEESLPRGDVELRAYQNF
jgi:hypothetical protein